MDEQQGFGLTRRQLCQGLGLMGLTLAVGGCESLPRLGFSNESGNAGIAPSSLTPEQVEAEVGTIEAVRSQAPGTESANEFLQRFLFHSPRVHAASQPGGPIGSVLYNPKPAAVASAVKLQLARGKDEPELLHNDLGEMAAAQYAHYGPRTFASIYPNSVSIVGDNIHKNRSLLQLVVNGGLPSEKIVCANEDLENLIGRQVTFASQLVHGIRCGTAMPLMRNDNIWMAEQSAIPEGAISLALASALIRLEVTGAAVRTITPRSRDKRPVGWQDVSEAYRNFAVGQLIEAEAALIAHVPRNAFEQSIRSRVLDEYRPYLDDVMQRLDWGHTCTKVYSEQKQDGRADLLVQPVFAHSIGARKQL